MRRTHLTIMLIASVTIALPCTLRAATGNQATRATPSRESTVQPVAPEEQRKAAAATQAATAEEQKITQRIRWVEAQLQREEQLLAQRLAYANRLRAAGLEKNDEKVLQQAEQYERQSLAAFQQRITQFEKMLQTTTTETSPTANEKAAGTTNREATSSKSTRSSARPHPQSRLIRRR